jgi:hypothetical protein
VRPNIYEQVPEETLQATLEDIELFYVSGASAPILISSTNDTAISAASRHPFCRH